MNRELLQCLSLERRREASALMKAGLFPGACYIAGYAVECALKACIAKQTRRHDFPDKRLVLEAWTHDLQRLVKLAGLGSELEESMNASPALKLNWTIVKDWNESSRYDLAATQVQAQDFYSACTTRTSGVLPWIRERW